MLRIIRIVLALACIVSISWLFLDVTGMAPDIVGWLAKWQFMPAFLSLNVLVLIVLIAVSLLFGRVYCSVLCPLGVMQDVVSWIHNKTNKRRKFGYKRALTGLRITMLVLFAMAIVGGLSYLAGFIEPYSEYGRIMTSLVKPIIVAANNALYDAQSADQYTFHHIDYVVNTTMVIVAGITFIAVAIMAWMGGRLYCNTICPVGTILGYLSQFSLLKPVINTNKCNGCGKCARKCKASCIDPKHHRIDYTRCVECMDCIDNCSQHAITYSRLRKVKPLTKKDISPTDTGRRQFLTASAILAGTAVIKAQEKTVDGGLATIIDKQKSARNTRIAPPGALSLDNLAYHCTACQLCITSCPNGVLRPSTDAATFMQPEVSFENGYCRPECTRCSEVCPAGAILPIDRAQRSATQVGHAVWVADLCLAASEGVKCDNCARHCPVGAITMIESAPGSSDSCKIPAINTERCIGCGACENLCPSRPFSAIYVEGHEIHRTI